MKPTIALIGGFLGAGKTTLILAAAELVQRRGANAVSYTHLTLPTKRIV